jgi:hypothetical protein
LDFPYPAIDPNSGLEIKHAGCQLIDGAAALEVARSRHYYYALSGHPTWPNRIAFRNMTDDEINNEILNDGFTYDGTSDFGRIDRQTSFLRAMFNRVKGKLDDPLALNSFLATLPKGVTIDDTFSLNEIIGLALKFHSYNTNAMQTYTMPEVPAVVNGADVETVEEPEAEQMLVNIFGKLVAASHEPAAQRRRTGHRTARHRSDHYDHRANDDDHEAPPRSDDHADDQSRRWPCHRTTRCPARPNPLRSLRRVPGSACSTTRWRT